MAGLGDSSETVRTASVQFHTACPSEEVAGAPTSIDAVTSIEALDGIEVCWRAWQTHVNQDLELFKLVCGTRAEVVSPFVLVVRQGTATRALVACRLERVHVHSTVGYLRLGSVPARVIVVLHRAVLGELSGEAAGQVVRHLQSALRRGVADAVRFDELDEHAPLLQAVQAGGSRLLRDRRLRWSVHREMAIPPQRPFMDEKVSAKHRSHFRKKLKQLEAAFPGRLTWRWLSSFEDIPGLCERLEALARRTYQRGLDAGFFDNEDFRRRFTLFANRGLLRMQILEIDGQVRAFWFGPVYQGVYHSSETGYDPDLRDYEIGSLVFLRMAEALRQEGVQRVDFGLGDALYKQRFGDFSLREATVWMFAGTAKGVLLRLVHGGSAWLDNTARQILARTGLTQRVKTAWRSRRAAPAADRERQGTA